jgi:GNAT superfamily N-acetyltransferase
MAMTVCSLADRPELADALWELPTSWPPFMLEDPAANLMHLLPTGFPELQLMLLDGDRLIAKAHAIAFHWPGELADLPDTGWDWVLLRGVWDRRPPTAVSALEISVDPAWQGKGLSRVMVEALLDAARRYGVTDLVAPIRPSGKAAEPATPMAEYVARVRADGLPADPWLRVHARLGGTILRICPMSMIIPGSLVQWREWTGLPFDRSGPVEVPGGLVPVHVDVAQGHAVYIEPNVWMRHPLH